MVPVPVYSPTIEVWRRSPDGCWDLCHGGPTTSWLFRPLGDEDGTIPRSRGLRRVVTGGSRPRCTVLAPPGSGVVAVGSTLRLRVPAPTAKDPGAAVLLDAFAARLRGTHRRDGFDLVRQIEVTFGPPPSGPIVPTRQLAMSFGD